MKLFWMLWIYSLLGCALELFYARCLCRSREGRRCRLLMPLCPVYGVGAVLILACPSPLRTSVPLWMLWGMLCATAAEYAAAVFYERCWHTAFWDYSGLPFQLHGRVCLPFSLVWGVLTLPLVRWVHPVVEEVLQRLPPWLGPPMAAACVADFLLTGWMLRKYGRIGLFFPHEQTGQRERFDV